MEHAPALAWWSALPFVGMLLSIAVIPLVAHHWWESNRNKGIIAALFAVPTALYLLLALGSLAAARPWSFRRSLR